jgi:hypothetical protein
MKFSHSLSALIYLNSNSEDFDFLGRSQLKKDNAQPTKVHQSETKINAPMYFSNDGEGSRGEMTIRNTLLVPISATRNQIIE